MTTMRGQEKTHFLRVLDEQRRAGTESIMSSLATHQTLIKEQGRNKRINNWATRKTTIKVKEISNSLFIITLMYMVLIIQLKVED